MNKQLLIVPFLVMPLITSCGGSKKPEEEWKEISRAEAINVEAKILENFKAPKFYSSNGKYTRNKEDLYSGVFEAYSEKDKFYTYRTINNINIETNHFLEYEGALWNLVEYKYATEALRLKESYPGVEPLETIQNAILYVYTTSIRVLDYSYDFAKYFKELHKKGDENYDGSYSFYTKGDASLKSSVSFKYPDEDQINNSFSVEIVIENNLIQSLNAGAVLENKSISLGDPIFSEFYEATYDYTNEPHLPPDANPNDWCD